MSKPMLFKPFGFAAVASTYLMLAAGGAASNHAAATGFGLKALSASRPVITCVSGFLPQRSQNLLIRGRGFGAHKPYRNRSIASIMVSNLTRKWNAGYKAGRFNDLVTLDVVLWTNTQIIVAGFAGLYGQRGWILRNGDRMRVQVWHASTLAGPANYLLTVGPIKNC